MTRQEAEDKGYCKHCAAWGQDRGCRCGISTRADEDKMCWLPAEVQARWKGEFGLEGETQRFVAENAFGNADLMPKKRGRKAKRYLK